MSINRSRVYRAAACRTIQSLGIKAIKWSLLCVVLWHNLWRTFATVKWGRLVTATVAGGNAAKSPRGDKMSEIAS